MIVPLPRATKSGHRRIGQPRQRRDVQADHVVHLVDVGGEQRLGGADARVVDQQGDAGIGPQDVLDALQVRRRREIGFDRLHLAAGFVGEPARQRREPLPCCGRPE